MMKNTTGSVVRKCDVRLALSSRLALLSRDDAGVRLFGAGLRAVLFPPLPYLFFSG
ncbi:MAG TPA: hypothetical protein VMT57_02515 [Candidatus Thermoplasmatota archaeon]|nr:hypothetical protein [Candidatus Thermoplasmatota archaeon]